MEKRMIQADAIRAFAVISMIIYHSSGIYLNFSFPPGQHSWWLTSALIRCATANCVPLFVMLSGMLLLEKVEPLSLFFKKRFIKIIIPFLSWIVIHFIYLIFIERRSYTPFELIKLTLQGPVYPHLWFMYMLIGLYLAVPILRIFCTKSDKSTLSYFIFLWLIGVGLLPIINRLFTVSINIPMAVTTAYVGYFVSGYYFKNLVLTSKQIRLAFVGLGILIFFTVMGFDILAGTKAKSGISFYLGFTRLNIILISFLSFLILKSSDYSQSSNFVKNTIIHISKTSFGVYLIHYIIITNLRNGSLGFTLQGIGNTLLHPLIGISLTAIATTIIAVGIITFLQRIPFVCKIVP